MAIKLSALPSTRLLPSLGTKMKNLLREKTMLLLSSKSVPRNLRLFFPSPSYVDNGNALWIISQLEAFQTVAVSLKSVTNWINLSKILGGESTQCADILNICKEQRIPTLRNSFSKINICI